MKSGTPVGEPAGIALPSFAPDLHIAGRLRAAISEARQTCHEVFGELELAGTRIAFLHGDDVYRLSQEIASGQWQLVCHGHTHVARKERQGETLVLNPGALYRATPHSIAYVELPAVEATIISLP